MSKYTCIEIADIVDIVRALAAWLQDDALAGPRDGHLARTQRHDQTDKEIADQWHLTTLKTIPQVSQSTNLI
eukprot:6182955-Pleurochrysis_carterae.AAC.1